MEKIPVIIDTDMAFGSVNADIDDAIALLLALSDEHLEILAVTPCGGNVSVDRSSCNVDSLLSQVGASHIPHACFGSRPLDPQLWVSHRWENQVPQQLSQLDSTEASSDLLRRTLRCSDKPVTVVCIGPLTNLALALTVEPSLCKKIDRLVMMGGSYRMPGVGNIPVEFNIKVDPVAAAIVFSMDMKIDMFPLDVTKKRRIYPDDVNVLTESKSSFLTSLHDASVAFMHHRAKRDGYDEPYAFFHDAMPVLSLRYPELFAMKACSVTVDLTGNLTHGMTIIDPRVDPNSAQVRYAYDVDSQAVLDIILKTLTERYSKVGL